MSRHDDDSSSFLWFLAGLGLGAAFGVLYAPRSGRETREAILERAEEGRDYVVNRAREAREQASHYVDRGKDVLNQQKEQFRSAVDSARQAYREATSGEGKPTT